VYIKKYMEGRSFSDRSAGHITFETDYITELKTFYGVQQQSYTIRLLFIIQFNILLIIDMG